LLARSPAADPRVKSLCSEFSIEIIGCHVYPLPGQTRAVVTIRRIIDRHGEAHARLLLWTLSETEGNGGLLDEVSLWAVSDLVLACPRYVERTSAWLQAWDRLPLGQFMFITQELSGRRPGFMRTPGQVFPGASPERELTIPPGLWPEPSDRERELVQLITTGHPTATIAGRLAITVGTVKNHRRRIYEKLDITTER
jgi:hypothetical protein